MDISEHYGTPGLTHRQRKAITALAACPTLEEASKRTRIGRSTLYLWLKDETFANAVEGVRKQQSKDALDFLRSCMLGAVQKLNGLLSSGNEGVARMAAKDLLEFGLRAVEAADLEARLLAIEQRLEEQRVTGGNSNGSARSFSPS